MGVWGLILWRLLTLGFCFIKGSHVHSQTFLFSQNHLQPCPCQVNTTWPEILNQYIKLIAMSWDLTPTVNTQYLDQVRGHYAELLLKSLIIHLRCLVLCLSWKLFLARESLRRISATKVFVLFFKEKYMVKRELLVWSANKTHPTDLLTSVNRLQMS